MSEELTGLRVRDIMTPDPVTVTPDTLVTDVARIMMDNGIGSVIVVDKDGNPVGIITEQDLISRVLAVKRHPAEVRARDVMSSPLIMVDPDMPLKDAAKIMADKGIGHLPVVQGSRLIGILAEHDIVRLAPELIELLYVGSGSARGF